LKTENNNADLTIIAESPNTAAEVWMRRAQQVPKAVLRPPLLPTMRVFFVAIAVSGPGKIIRKIHIATNR
jgi:hypothetical protein